MNFIFDILTVEVIYLDAKKRYFYKVLDDLLAAETPGFGRCKNIEPHVASYLVKGKQSTPLLDDEVKKFNKKGQGVEEIFNALESNNEEKGYQKKLK